MLIKKIIQVSLLFSCAWALSCTDLDGSTSLGQDIVNDIDPNRTDFNRNIAPFTDSLIVKKAKSTAFPTDTSLGINKGIITVGNKLDRNALASVVFLFNKTFKENHAKNVFTKISFLFYADVSDTTQKAYPKSITIFDNATYNLSNRNVLDSKTKLVTADSTKITVTDSTKNFKYVGTTTDSAAIKSLLSCIYSANDSTIGRYGILVSTDDIRVRLKTPAFIIIESKRDTSTIIDTLKSSYSNFAVYESQKLADSLNSFPYTSLETGRKAIFEIDLTNFWKEMEKRVDNITFNEILMTTLTIKGEVLPGENATYEVPYQYYLSSSPDTNENTLRDSINANGIYNNPDSTSLVNGQAIRIDKFLRRFIAMDPRPNTVYLYISNINSKINNAPKNYLWQETSWHIKSPLTAVFTNTK